MYQGKESEDPAFDTAVLDIKLRHQLLKDDVAVMVSPTNVTASFEQIMSVCLEGYLPIVIYAVANSTLSQKVSFYCIRTTYIILEYKMKEIIKLYICI